MQKLACLLLVAFALLFCERAVAWGQQPRHHSSAHVSRPKINHPRGIRGGGASSTRHQASRGTMSDRQRRGYYSRVHGNVTP